MRSCEGASLYNTVSHKPNLRLDLLKSSGKWWILVGRRSHVHRHEDRGAPLPAPPRLSTRERCINTLKLRRSAQAPIVWHWASSFVPPPCSACALYIQPAQSAAGKHMRLEIKRPETCGAGYSMGMLQEVLFVRFMACKPLVSNLSHSMCRCVWVWNTLFPPWQGFHIVLANRKEAMLARFPRPRAPTQQIHRKGNKEQCRCERSAALCAPWHHHFVVCEQLCLSQNRRWEVSWPSDDLWRLGGGGAFGVQTGKKTFLWVCCVSLWSFCITLWFLLSLICCSFVSTAFTVSLYFFVACHPVIYLSIIFCETFSFSCSKLKQFLYLCCFLVFVILCVLYLYDWIVSLCFVLCLSSCCVSSCCVLSCTSL